MMHCARRSSTEAADAIGPRILVIDDEPDICAAISLLLSSAGFNVLCCSNPEQALMSCCERATACIVLDVFLQQASGLDLLKTIRARGCDTPVLMMSGRGEISHAVEAIKLGAFDFLEKPFRSDELLRQVAAAIAADAAPERTAFRFPGREPLTPRELDVLAELVAGRSTREVAARLELSPRTIESHRVNIMRKVGARNPAELVRLAIAAIRR